MSYSKKFYLYRKPGNLFKINNLEKCFDKISRVCGHWEKFNI